MTLIGRRDFLKGLLVTTGAIHGGVLSLPFIVIDKNLSAAFAQAEIIKRNATGSRSDNVSGMHRYVLGTAVYSQPEIPKPPKGIPFTDPVFGTRITRISDRKIDGLKLFSNKAASLMHPSYPKHCYDNADGSQILFQGSFKSGQVLYDSSSFKLIKALNARAVNWNQPIEPRWDAHNPAHLYFHFSPPTTLSRYDTARDSLEVVRDFARDFPGATSISMEEEGNCSYDSRYFAFILKGLRGGDKWAHCAVFCYDRVDDRIVGRVNLPIPGFERQGGGNWVGMSPSGKYVLLGTAPMLAYDREFKGAPVRLTHGGGWHCAVGLDDEGREVIFYAGGKTYSPRGQSSGRFAMCDLATGKETVLSERIGSGDQIGMHFDASCMFTPGWGLVSTYHPKVQAQTHWTEYGIFLVELTRRTNPPPRIWRVAHTHVNRDGYIDDPFATLSRFGTKIFFGSNWMIPFDKGGDIDAYQVELPDGWYVDLMGKEKADRLKNIAHEMSRRKWQH